MNSRQRLFAALSGEKTDRTPIWLLFPYHPTGYYADVRNNPCYAKIVGLAERCAITLDRRGIGASIFSPEVKIENSALTENGVNIQKNILEYKGVVN